MVKVLKGKSIKVIVLALICCMLSITAWASTEEEKPTADLSVSFLSQFIWRGFEKTQDSMVIQPAMAMEYKGFAIDLWGNLNTDSSNVSTDNWTETEMTVSYSQALGMTELTGGYIYYSLDAEEDSQELFVKASVDTLLNPTVTVYREIWHSPYWYFTFDVSHSLPITNDINLDLGAEISYFLSNDPEIYHEPSNHEEELNDFHTCLLSVSTTIPVAKYISVTPELHYSFALGSESSDLIDAKSIDGNDHNFLYGGVTVNISM